LTFTKSPNNRNEQFSLPLLEKRVILLLGDWRNHTDFQKFMIERVNREFKHNPNSIKYHETAILKMYYLNLDGVKEDFAPQFSPTGRPSNQQPELFRSFVLMPHYSHLN
jgi:hypothetical protein